MKELPVRAAENYINVICIPLAVFIGFVILRYLWTDIKNSAEKAAKNRRKWKN